MDIVTIKQVDGKYTVVYLGKEVIEKTTLVKATKALSQLVKGQS